DGRSRSCNTWRCSRRSRRPASSSGGRWWRTSPNSPRAPPEIVQRLAEYLVGQSGIELFGKTYTARQLTHGLFDAIGGLLGARVLMGLRRLCRRSGGVLCKIRLTWSPGAAAVFDRPVHDRAPRDFG